MRFPILILDRDSGAVDVYFTVEEATSSIESRKSSHYEAFDADGYAIQIAKTTPTTFIDLTSGIQLLPLKSRDEEKLRAALVKHLASSGHAVENNVSLELLVDELIMHSRGKAQRINWKFAIESVIVCLLFLISVIVQQVTFIDYDFARIAQAIAFVVQLTAAAWFWRNRHRFRR